MLPGKITQRHHRNGQQLIRAERFPSGPTAMNQLSSKSRVESLAGGLLPIRSRIVHRVSYGRAEIARDPAIRLDGLTAAEGLPSR
jgi:hypothetical protein